MLLLCVAFTGGLVPVFASSEQNMASDALAQQSRWDISPEIHDTYTYRICESAKTCYDAAFTVIHSTKHTVTMSVSISEILGVYLTGTDGPYRLYVPTGYESQDSPTIHYADYTGEPIQFEITFDPQAHKIISHTAPYSHTYFHSIKNTLFLLGEGIRIGDGTLLEHPPILAVGERWSRDNDVNVYVIDTEGHYFFEGLQYAGLLYMVQYSDRTVLADFIISPDTPLPIAAEVTADYTEISEEKYIDTRFWYRLIDSSIIPNQSKMVSDVTPDTILPEPLCLYNNIPVSCHDPGTPEIVLPDPPMVPHTPEVTTNKTVDFTVLPPEIITKILNSTESELEELFELFLKYIGQKPSFEITLNTDSDTYTHGDEIIFSGTSSSVVSDTAQIMIYDVHNATIASVPVTGIDGTYSTSIDTNGWDVHGVFGATISHDTLKSQVFFEIKPDDRRVTVDGRLTDGIDTGDGYVVIHLKAGSATEILVTFSRTVLDSVSDGKTAPFEILVDSQSVPYDDFSTSAHRIIAIPNIPTFAHIVEMFPLGVEKQACTGKAACISGVLAEVIDGDTIRLQDGSRIRFTLSSAPELTQSSGIQAKQEIASVCPADSEVTIDEDDGQKYDSFGRTIGIVYCNGINLNSHLLESGYGTISKEFCKTSEFGLHDWAIQHGCPGLSDVP